MMKKTARIPALLALILCVFMLNAAHAQPVPSADLEASTGFIPPATSAIAISSASATLVGTIPVGTKEIWLYSTSQFNYGDSGISTQTYEMFWKPTTEVTASGTTHLYWSSPLVLGKFVTRNPKVYLRCRGSDSTATVYMKCK